MAPALLLHLLRALQKSSIKLTQGCRYLWTLLWRFLQSCASFINKRHRPRGIPPQGPYDVGSCMGGSVVETIAEDTQILASYVPSDSKRASLVSVVLPSSPLLRAGGVTSLGGTGSTGFSDGIEQHIYPLLPSKIPRYKRPRYIDDDGVDCEVDALQDTFSLGVLPDGWEQIIHPEGQPYFYHASKRIVTECWILNPLELKKLATFIDKFEDFTQSRNVSQPEDAHLVLEIATEDGIDWCGYYYASASTRSLFWLEKYTLSSFVSEVRGELSPTHTKLFLEYQYWYHWDLFPHVNASTQEVYVLVANTIADARTDVQTSATTTINYSKDDLKEMADIVESATRRRSSNSNWCLGRFMHILLKDRFINYHGQYGARLNHTQSIYATKRDRKSKRTWLITVFSPLLFSAPNVHLKSLNDLWVDELTLRPRCRAFFVKLNGQWGEHIVHASILLNANVAFLAIVSNDPSNNSSTLLAARTAAQIASYVSVVTSFASMMLALLLVRKHKTKEGATEDVNTYHKYLEGHNHANRGFEDLAIIHSLPYALLAWGMTTFLIAFISMCLERSTTTARAVVGIPTLLICGLIIWCIRMFWERTEHDWTGRVRTFFENDVSETDEKLDETRQEDVDEKGQDDRSATIRAGATAKMDFVDGCSTRTAFSRSNIHWPLSLSQLKRKDSDTSSQA